MWKSPLRAELAAAGARFARYGDCELAERFVTDVRREYAAVRNATGVVDVSYRRKLRVTGSDRVTFLQGMLSNDVASLRPGAGCHAAFLTAQGRVVADVRVYVLEDAVLLETEPAAFSGLRAGLERHVVADDVEIAEVTEETVTLSLQGAGADLMIGAATREVPALAREFDHAEVLVGGYPARLARRGEVGEPGYQIFASTQTGGDLWSHMLERGRPLGLCPVGRTAFNILRVEAGVAWYGHDMDGSRMVLEVGLEDAISTTKGCYLGQEVVERVGARGHVTRKLTGLRVDGAAVPPPGAAVEADGKAIGVVTSAVDSPAVGGPIALAYVRREFLAPGTAVVVQMSDGAVAAEVKALPFYGR